MVLHVNSQHPSLKQILLILDEHAIRCCKQNQKKNSKHPEQGLTSELSKMFFTPKHHWYPCLHRNPKKLSPSKTGG